MKKVEGKVRPEFRVRADQLMQDAWLAMARDFRVQLGSPSFMARAETIVQAKGLRALRNYDFGPLVGPAELVKMDYQLRSWTKRYISLGDVCSAEIEKRSLREFIKYQEALGKVDWAPRTERASRVLREARRICREVLREYDLKEHIGSCAFGKKASVGVPLGSATLLNKWRTLTGTPEHIAWFAEEILKKDQTALAVSVDVQAEMIPCSSLVCTAVPKSWKAARIIAPDTTLGGFYSKGMGKVIELRLRDIGIDIRRQPQLHHKLAKRWSNPEMGASEDINLITADLSKASDSLSNSLVNAVLPRKWYKAVRYGRLKYATISSEALGRKKGSDDVTIPINSFMLMGSGHTFTLQTVLFYCLLKAISKLSGIEGRISVYGDDLIYPRKLHRFVSGVFSDLGIVLNVDKTFTFEPFRESCGADFYKGVDVRPCQPEMVADSLGLTEYLAFCYKLLNTLLRRWNHLEIPGCVEVILDEIRHYGPILQVPPTFPDNSGFKVCKAFTCDDDFSAVATELKTFTLTFAYLASKKARVFVDRTSCWFYQWLQSQKDQDLDEAMPWELEHGSLPDVSEPPLRNLYLISKKHTAVLKTAAGGRIRVNGKYTLIKYISADRLSTHLEKGYRIRSCFTSVSIPAKTGIVQTAGSSSSWTA